MEEPRKRGPEQQHAMQMAVMRAELGLIEAAKAFDDGQSAFFIGILTAFRAHVATLIAASKLCQELERKEAKEVRWN